VRFFVLLIVLSVSCPQPNTRTHVAVNRSASQSRLPDLSIIADSLPNRWSAGGFKSSDLRKGENKKGETTNSTMIKLMASSVEKAVMMATKHFGIAKMGTVRCVF
jgi:hypothetical protein